MKKVACGQVWRLVNPQYNVGSKDEIFIILSLYKEQWKIGCFWAIDGKLGGAREKELTEAEINEIGRYVGMVSDIGPRHYLRRMWKSIRDLGCKMGVHQWRYSKNGVPWDGRYCVHCRRWEP